MCDGGHLRRAVLQIGHTIFSVWSHLAVGTLLAWCRPGARSARLGRACDQASAASRTDGAFMDPQQTAKGRISDYVRPLTSRWWMVLLIVVVATGAVYVYEARKPPIYTASTLVYYQDPGDPITGQLSAPQTDRNVLDQAALLYSRDTAAIVAKKIGWRGTLSSLLQAVTISSKEGEDFIQVTAQAGTGPQAAQITNQFGATLVRLLISRVDTRLREGIALTQRQLATLPNTLANAPQRQQLETQLNQIQFSLKDPPLISRQVDTALAPGSPSSPRPLRDALFAFILSLLAAIALVYGLERFDRRLKTPEEMEQAYGRPLLSVLPHASAPIAHVEGEASLAPEFREPFRVLRTNLELESLDAPPRTIVVSSAMPGEGKSTVVRNLALAFREAGKTVAVVDLDLRHPMMGQNFGHNREIGVTDVLRHQVSLDDAIIPVGVGLDALAAFMLAKSEGRHAGEARVLSPRPGNGNGNTTRPHAEVGLLLSGTRPANPTVVLASERVVEVLDELKERYDIVLIDSAPVLAVSDTVPLLRYADAALFVGRFHVTTRDTARRLMEFVRRLPGLNLLGIVANDLPRIDAAGYGYGYGYYGKEPDASGQKRRRLKPKPEVPTSV
jgi:Mrp family chromosome partitioning ATPase/capsular polysaccharide biosynthesis protein